MKNDDSSMHWTLEEFVEKASSLKQQKDIELAAKQSILNLVWFPEFMETCLERAKFDERGTSASFKLNELNGEQIAFLRDKGLYVCTDASFISPPTKFIVNWEPLFTPEESSIGKE